MMPRTFAVAWYAVLLATSPGHAQQRNSPVPAPVTDAGFAAHSAGLPALQRPRIGLVLGGGGARGGAHVGVLRVLEEMHVPVDAIAGTSMGAIVGALYASGMTVSEVERSLLTTDWSRVLSVRPDRRVREIRRKQDDPHLLVDFELGFRSGRLRVPGGLIGAHEPTLLLETLLLPVSHIHDYDALPIPFRAVATDIGTGEAVILRGGPLAQSVRASMSIPGAFPAVAIDGRLLVDGGVVRNLPIEIVRSMDVDVVIAVDVGTPLQDTTSLGSAFGLLGQTLIIVTRANADAQLEHLRDGDLHLQPDVGSVGTLDFHRIELALEAGERAARAAEATLRQLAVPAAEYDRISRARRPRDRTIIIDTVRVAAVPHYSSRAIEGRIRLQRGDTLRTDVLTQDMRRIYALGVFQQVGFDVVDEGGRDVLLVRPIEKPWGPNFLRLGFGLLNASEGHSSFDLIVNYTMTGIGPLDADLRTEAQVGLLRRVFAEFFQPLSATGRFFVAPSLEARERTAPLDFASLRVSDYDIEHLAAGFDIGRQLGPWGQVRLGIRHQKVDAEPDIRLTAPDLETRQTQYAARLLVDDLDDVAFPGAGVAGFLAVTQVDVSPHDSLTNDHARVEAGLLVARSRGPHTLVAGLEGRASVASALPVYDRLALGGLFRLSGLEPNDISGDAAALVRILYFNRTSSAGSLGLAGGLRIGGSLEFGNTWNYRKASLGNVRMAGSAFVALETVLGPLYLAYGIADRGRKSWYLLLGQAIL
jgi:NTE family protein